MKKIIISSLAFFALSSSSLFAQTMQIVDTDGLGYTVEAEENNINISGMEGKVVFLEFFGLNCPACKQEMPHLINIQNRLANKVNVMAIEVQQHEVQPINAYKQLNGINYPTFSNFDIGLLVRYIADRSDWDGKIPFMVAIDSKGAVKFAQAGLISEKELEGYVEKFSK